jgi:hypothetical protein
MRFHLPAKPLALITMLLVVAALGAFVQAARTGAPRDVPIAADVATQPPGPMATPSANLAAQPDPTPTATPGTQPTATPDPTLQPTPTAGQAVPPKPTPRPPAAPAALNLYRGAGFRTQDPSLVACTSTSVMDMLNFIALGGRGGAGFRWKVSLTSSTRDLVLAWERAHDTLAPTSPGSDPHGWRNALNRYGWGDGTLSAGRRVYEDMAFGSYASAMQTAVRQLILTRKPVGIVAWAGRHAQVMTGYYGLVGNPLARNADGTWANAFTIAGIYLSDPLLADHRVNVRVSYAAFRASADLHLRFAVYRETDSPYDDPYTPGRLVSRLEWYDRFVMIVPVR